MANIVAVPQYVIPPIVKKTTQGIPFGTICYMQTGEWGAPIGLLSSLTITPQYVKVISTDRGFQRIL